MDLFTDVMKLYNNNNSNTLLIALDGCVRYATTSRGKRVSTQLHWQTQSLDIFTSYKRCWCYCRVGGTFPAAGQEAAAETVGWEAVAATSFSNGTGICGNGADSDDRNEGDE
jgi:hypothetical protein